MVFIYLYFLYIILSFFLINLLGSETTSSTLEWMIALLTNHPEIQERAYKEIKENVGLDILPTSDDGKNEMK